MFEKVQHYAKFVAALLGTVITAGTTLIPDEDLKWVSFAAAILTSIAVYAVPNKQPEAGPFVTKP